MGDVGGKLAAGLLGSVRSVAMWSKVTASWPSPPGALTPSPGRRAPGGQPAAALQRRAGLDAEELGCLAKRAWLP